MRSRHVCGFLMLVFTVFLAVLLAPVQAGGGGTAGAAPTPQGQPVTSDQGEGQLWEEVMLQVLQHLSLSGSKATFGTALSLVLLRIP